MKRVKIFDGDGRCREERENCFPSTQYQEEKQKGIGQVRDDG